MFLLCTIISHHMVHFTIVKCNLKKKKRTPVQMSYMKLFLFFSGSIETLLAYGIRMKLMKIILKNVVVLLIFKQRNRVKLIVYCNSNVAFYIANKKRKLYSEFRSNPRKNIVFIFVNFVMILLIELTRQAIMKIRQKYSLRIIQLQNVYVVVVHFSTTNYILNRQLTHTPNEIKRF